MNDYECKECGSPAEVVDGQVVRTCQHNGVVIAQRKAVVTGEGSAQ